MLYKLAWAEPEGAKPSPMTCVFLSFLFCILVTFGSQLFVLIFPHYP